jgi:hypothetical protein
VEPQGSKPIVSDKSSQHSERGLNLLDVVLDTPVKFAEENPAGD